MDDNVGIEYQTVFGYPPVDFVHLAADLGCHAISMKAATNSFIPHNPYGYDPFSFLDDTALRRRMIAALRDRQVSISLAEGFVILPGTDLTEDLSSLDVMAELGATRANAVTLDPDLGRSFDQIAAFVECAAERGMQTTMEFAKSLAVADLDTALAAVRYVNRPEFGLVADTMHVVRSGSTAEDLAALDPSVFAYVQLCDSTVQQQHATYGEDTANRSVPGEGELPLVDILAALPDGLPVGVEVPMLSFATGGTTAQECARRAVVGGRKVLAEARARRAARM
jgi:sugar phosphate isomerase/epimerase